MTYYDKNLRGGVSTGGNTAGTTGTVGGQLVFVGGANVTLSQSRNGAQATVTIIGGAGGGGGIAASAAGNSVSDGTVVWSNSNNVSFGMAGSTITATATFAGGDAIRGIAAGGSTASTSTVNFSNQNGISFGFGAAGNSTVITASHNALTSQSNQALSAANGSFTFQTAQFHNSNGISWSTTTGSGIVASHNGLTSQSNQAFSAAGGSSAFQTLGFSDNAHLSFTNTNGSVAAAPIRASLFAASNTTQSTSGTQNLSALSFAGAGIASVGVTNGSVVVSVPAGGGAGDGGVFAGVSTGGNTLGSTGTVSTGNFVLVGLNGITLSQSTGAAGSAATVSILGPQSTLSGMYWGPMAGKGGPGYFAQSSFSLGQNSLYIYPVQLEDFLTVDHLRMPVMVTNSSSAAASVQKGYTYRFGIYTRNATNATVLTQHYSTSYTLAASHNSNVSWGQSIITAIGNSTSYNTLTASSAGLNLSASLHGPREFIMPISSLMTPGEYWMALHASTSSAGAAGSVLQLSNLGIAVQTFNRPGGSTNATSSGWYQFMGHGTYSATTAALPGGISATQINQLGSVPILFAATGTV